MTLPNTSDGPARWTLYGEGYFIPETLLGGEQVEVVEASAYDKLVALCAEAIELAESREKHDLDGEAARLTEGLEALR